MPEAALNAQICMASLSISTEPPPAPNERLCAPDRRSSPRLTAAPNNQADPACGQLRVAITLRDEIDAAREGSSTTPLHRT